MKTYKILYLPTYPGDVVEIHEWTLEAILAEVNRDHSDKWTDYDETDWEEGWNEWVEGEFYSLIKEQ